MVAVTFFRAPGDGTEERGSLEGLFMMLEK
jgi:hypothetical protein